MGGRGASSGVSSGKRSAGSFKANGSSRFWGNYETTSRKYAKIENFAKFAQKCRKICT